MIYQETLKANSNSVIKWQVISEEKYSVGRCFFPQIIHP
jgi:hypothetical protein